MKSILLCLELLLEAAGQIVEWQRRYAGALEQSKADAGVIAEAKKAYEAAAANIKEQNASIEELRKALEASQADDSQVAELEKRAAEILEKVAGVVRGGSEVKAEAKA
jgi:ATPase subunit of ABC transporter with duplicated ATPase domains